MYPNKEAQLKERFAKAFETIGAQLKRANDISMMRADNQQKTQMALFSLVEPMLKKMLADQRGEEPSRRGKKRGKVIQLRRPR